MPFSSDPLGLGWNLFGNAGLVVEPNLIDLQVLWSFVVAAIVFGHLLSVYLAHVVTLDLCADKRHVVRGQLPLLALMIGYTMLSIWILVQPNYA